MPGPAVLLLVLAVAADPLADARQRLHAGNYAEARAGFEKLLADPKDGPTAAVGLSLARRAEGDYQPAIDGLTEALKAFPNHPDVLAARGDALFDVGRWEDAAADAEGAMKTVPDHFLARWVRARVLRDKGDLESADKEMRWFVRAYTAASNADREITDPDKLFVIGQAAAENARWNRLPDQFRYILRNIYRDEGKPRGRWEAESLSGDLLLEKFNRPEAVEAFDDALKLNPQAADALVGKGRAALMKFEAKDAEGFAKQALKVNPRLPSALRLLADVEYMGGNLAAAEKHLAAARAVNPRDAATLGKLAAVYRVQRRTAEFEAVVKAAEGFDAKPAAFYTALAEALDDRKLYPVAEGYFRRAVSLRPKLAAPLAALGMLQLRMGQEKEGRATLDAAFAADKFNVRVANMRKVMDHLDKYATITTPHYEIRYNPETDKILAAFVAEYAEEVHAELKEKFGYEPVGRIPVQIFSRHEMFSGRTVGLPDLHTIGASTGRVVAMASPHAVGVAKPFNWARVLRHELVHVFNLTQTEFQCPHWLTEGLAVRQENMARPPQWLQTLRDRFDAGTLLDLDTVLMGFVRPRSPDEWALAYCQSNLYVEYLTKTYGEKSVGKLLEAYRAGLDTTAALRAACGADRAEFEKGYRGYVEQLLKPYRTGKGAKPTDDKPMTFEELTAAQRKNPDDVELSAKLADQLFRRGKAGEARKLADAVLAKQTGHPLAAVVKARLLSRAGDDEAAGKVLEEAVAASPDDPRLLLAVGHYYVEAKEYAKAADVLERGRKVAPLDGDWLEQLARLYAETKNTEKLAGVLREVVSHDPDELAGRIKLARLSLEAKKLDDAEAFALDAVRIDVTNEDARALLLEALKANGKADRAAELAKRFGG
jgi:predicted Zn-dependent protease